MGVCTSVPKDSDASMKYRLGLASKAKKLFLASPAKEKAFDGDGFGSQSPEFGSKNKIFFDTQAWFDSDCDDDFFSVNGEFTPSRGSTPIHPLSTPPTPKLDDHFLFDKSPYSKSEPSPTSRKKLAELLLETSQIEKQLDSSNITQVKEEEDANAKSDIDKTSPAPLTPNSLNATSCRSGASSGCSAEVTPSSDRTGRKEKAWKTGHCCWPSLQSYGFDGGGKSTA